MDKECHKEGEQEMSKEKYIRACARRFLDAVKNSLDGEAGEIQQKMNEMGVDTNDAFAVDERLGKILGMMLRSDFENIFGGTMVLSQVISGDVEIY